jgi:uncharacterized protein YrrD
LASGPAPRDRDYWLSRSRGFRVFAASEEIGAVDDVYENRRGPRLLLVASGFLGRDGRIVPVEDVVAIDPEEGRIELARDDGPSPPSRPAT